MLHDFRGVVTVSKLQTQTAVKNPRGREEVGVTLRCRRSSAYKLDGSISKVTSPVEINVPFSVNLGLFTYLHDICGCGFESG